MPRYYCDYCDTYLTHDSPSVRKQHNAGYKHKANVRIYYQQFEEQQTQILIDQRIKEHLGQAAALQQVGAAYAAWQRAQPSVLPTPILPLPVGPTGAPLAPGIRPPVFPRPPGLGPPVYGAPLSMAPPPGSGQPSVPTVSAPGNAPTQAPPLNTSGAASTPSLNGGPSFSAPPQHMYQAAPTGPNPNFGGGPSISAPPGPPTSFPNNSGNSASMPATSTDGLPFGQAPNGNQ